MSFCYFVLKRLDFAMAKHINRVPYSRTRHEAGIIRPVANVGTVLKTLGQTPGTFVTTPGGARSLAYEGESRVCVDVVTPGYSSIISNGGIINNPFLSVRCNCTQGGVGQVTQYIGSLDPWSPGSSYSLDVTSTLRTYDGRYLFGDVIAADGTVNVTALLAEIDTSRLYTIAKTSALSKVDQNLASGLVGLGELRATLTSLLNPLASIRQYISAKNRRRLLRQMPADAGVSKALANEYLAFYYGLLPFCRDIESYIDAYVNSGAQRERITARGGASDSHKSQTQETWTPVSGVSTYSHLFTHEVQVEVRSGILHEPTPMSWQKAYGVRFSDFFDAAYQLTPWSFFVDYFSNLGKLVNALTPRSGVTYLASWSTLEATILDRAECTGGGMGAPWSWSRGNTEWAQRVIKVRVRTPESPYTNVGFALKTGDWSSKAKVMAVLSLIIQQVF